VKPFSPTDREVSTVIDWDRIVSAYGPMVFAAAYRILGHTADTEDVVQDVFLQAYRMQAEAPIRNWPGLLRRLAACRALDRLRRRRAVASLEADVPEDQAGPPEVAVGNELAERLRDALSLLPPREGTVFCLRYFEDLTYSQIAEVLQISGSAVAVALHKARSRLETLLLEPSEENDSCPTNQPTPMRR
jgi:RNA polymerase sigma-70 factor (ECF subfamily)